jgi:hypothetical protein
MESNPPLVQRAVNTVQAMTKEHPVATTVAVVVIGGAGILQ